MNIKYSLRFTYLREDNSDKQFFESLHQHFKNLRELNVDDQYLHREFKPQKPKLMPDRIYKNVLNILREYDEEILDQETMTRKSTGIYDILKQIFGKKADGQQYDDSG